MLATSVRFTAFSPLNYMRIYRLSRQALRRNTWLSFTYWNFNNGLSHCQPWIDPRSSQGYGLLPYCRFRLPPQSHYMCRSFRPLPLLLNHFTLRFRFCNVHEETMKSFAHVFIYRVRSSGCPFYVYEDCIGFCMSLLTIKHSGMILDKTNRALWRPFSQHSASW